MTGRAFFLAGEPVPCPRPRARAILKRFGLKQKWIAQIFMPKVYTDWKARTARAVAAQWRGPALDCPLQVTLHAGFARLKSTPKRVGLGRLFHAVKGRNDIDNVTKSYLDVLQDAGVLVDDGLVDQLIAWKFRVGADEQPGVRIRVIPLRAED